MKKSYEEECGRRYDLVRACLNGGCPQMIPSIDNFLEYIATGKRAKIVTEAERLSDELSEKNESIEEIKKKMTVADETIDKLTELLEHLTNEIESTKDSFNAVRKEIYESLEDPSVILQGEGLTAKEIARHIGETNGKTYVEMNGILYKIKAIYAYDAKRIFEVDSQGWELAEDNGNGIKKAKDHTLKIVDSICLFERLYNEFYRRVKGYSCF